jgi:hypothetical protein
VGLTLGQHREILASMPWVAVSPMSKIFGKRCEGFLTDMPLYAWRLSQEDPDALALNKWRCTKRARWVFLALDGTIHTYCWHHLFIYGLESSPEEQERYQAWLTRYMETHPDPPDWTDEEPDMPLSRH